MEVVGVFVQLDCPGEAIAVGVKVIGRAIDILQAGHPRVILQIENTAIVPLPAVCRLDTRHRLR